MGRKTLLINPSAPSSSARAISPATAAFFVGITALASLAAVEGILRVAGVVYTRYQDRLIRQATEAPEGAKASSVILCYGGSYVFGLPESDYPSELERMLNAGERGGPYRIVNMAKWGYGNTSTYAERLENDIRAFRPEMIIINLNYRDSSVKHKPASGSGPAQKLSFLLRGFERLKLYQVAIYLFSLRRIDPVDPGDAPLPAVLPKERTAAGYVKLAGDLTLLRRYELAEKALLKAIFLDSGSAARLTLAKNYETRGLYRESQKQLEGALAVNDTAAVRLQLAGVLRLQGHMVEAERHLNRVRGNHSISAALALAEWHAKSNDFASAETDLRSAMASSEDPRLRLRLVRVFLDGGRIEEARRILAAEKTVSADVHLAWADYHEAVGRDADAESRLRRALALDPAPKTRLALVNFYRRRWRYAEAESHLRELARRRGEAGDILNLSRILDAQRRFEEQAAVLKAGLARHDTPTLRAELYFCYKNLGRIEEAQRLFPTAFGVADTEFYYEEKNRLYRLQGKHDLARIYEPTYFTLRENLESIAATCRRYGVKLCFENCSLRHITIERVAREVAARHDVPFVDVMAAYDALPAAQRAQLKDGTHHFTAAGYRWVAEQMHRHLRELL